MTLVILSGDLNVLEGARALFPLAHTDAIADPEDRKLIIAIESETDHLPVGDVRQYWSADALRDKDVEIARCEQLWKDQLLEACRRIVAG